MTSTSIKGAIQPWGRELSRDLAALTGELSLIIVGPGPVEYHAAAPVSQQVEKIAAARERWAQNFSFHLFSPEVEYRYDQGVGTVLSVAPEGPYDLVERDCYLTGATQGPASSGRIRVREFVRDGAAVELKLEQFI
jgi:hypothetical protein